MNTLEKTHEECIDVCNGLLRGERSAIETYDKAIEKFSDEASAPKLRKLRETHTQAVQILENQVCQMGGTPDNDSGAWGTFANTVQSAANLLGEGSAVNALQQGERHGRSSYEDALENDDVVMTCKETIRTKLLPNCRENVQVLEELEQCV